jgi:hypothetical protein
MNIKSLIFQMYQLTNASPQIKKAHLSRQQAAVIIRWDAKPWMMSNLGNLMNSTEGIPDSMQLILQFLRIGPLRYEVFQSLDLFNSPSLNAL